ncbi:MAG TPA: DUF6036 family nucleotidyltransferase [Terriglobales bacterium]|jgi:hypothetical protein|nr:DUF6036 family nucleotidyltransferase [Terriglobales bacterium]
MPFKPELPAPWPAFLSDLDESLSEPVELHCVGGFVLTVVYGVPRSTADLDYITAIPGSAFNEVERLAGRNSKLAHKYKVYVQPAGGVTDLPDNYDTRLVDLNLGFRSLILKVLEPYDLVLSKLTRNSPKDREDVKYLATKLTLSFRTTFERFATEMKHWIANPDRHELTLTRVWQEYFAE